jgi:hypothetical protein
MLFASPSALPFIAPFLDPTYWAKYPQLSYMRSVAIVFYILIWIGDYTGMIYLIYKWAHNPY